MTERRKLSDISLNEFKELIQRETYTYFVIVDENKCKWKAFRVGNDKVFCDMGSNRKLETSQTICNPGILYINSLEVDYFVYSEEDYKKYLVLRIL